MPACAAHPCRPGGGVVAAEADDADPLTWIRLNGSVLPGKRETPFSWWSHFEAAP